MSGLAASSRWRRRRVIAGDQSALARVEAEGSAMNVPASWSSLFREAHGPGSPCAGTPSRCTGPQLAVPSGLHREVDAFGTPTRRTAKAGAARG